jgi:hypothetical protein
MKRRWGSLALALLAASAASAGQTAPWPTPAKAGAQVFRYEAQEAAPGSIKGYRTDFRLRTEHAGGVTAEIISSQTFDGKTWTPVAADPACLAAMGARPGELATVRLYPMTPERARLGDAFLAACAPAGVFFPLTDILNVTLILASDTFGVRKLAAPGDKASFAGFSTTLDRLGIQMAEASDGGEVTLVSMDEDQATLDWKPTTSKITLVEQAGGSAVHLSGTETFAFRLVVGRRTGALVRAQSIHDDLDLAIAAPGLPVDKPPRMAVKRTVSISPR